MAKKPTVPLKITAILADGMINSSNGILMLDSVLYHAWFIKHAPHVLEGRGDAKYDGHIGLPLRQLPGNRWCASRGVYEEIERGVEFINKRPDFFNADKIGFLDADKGIICQTAGKYRAYRIPNIIRTVKGGTITFYAVGHKKEVAEMLDLMPALGKKYAAGFGRVKEWVVEEIEEDYTLWHPLHGLMRPVELGSDEAVGLDLSAYPVLPYCTKPPYWKAKNRRLCYVPIKY